MAYQRSMHVVFDTNSIWAGTAHQFLSPSASKLIKTHSDAPLDIHWYLPPIVKSEREYQMTNEAKALLPSLKKAEKLLRKSFDITTETLTTQVQQTIANQIEAHQINVPRFDTGRVDWDELINRAVLRLPPFERGDKEKGFRDSIVLEMFLQLHKSLGISAPSQLVLVSSDTLLRAAITERLGNRPEVALYASIEALETSIVALSAELDQTLAQEIVLTARKFLDENMTVGRLSKLLFGKYGDQLRAGPPTGGSVTQWQIAWGETALVAKQNSRLRFQTTILVQASAWQTVHISPFIQNTAQNIIVTTASATTLSASDASNTVSATSFGGQPSAGTHIFTTSSAPASLNRVSTSVISPEETRMVQNIGRHWLRLTWSAKSAESGKLIEFEPGAVEYDDVKWE